MKKIIKQCNLYATQELQLEIKQFKKLQNANIISIFGPKFSGKKHLTLYFLNKWNKTIYLINCTNGNFQNNIEKIKKIISNQNQINEKQETSFIINHPENLSKQNQIVLIKILEQNIGSKNIQWINIINNYENIIPTLLERIKIFTIIMPALNKRKSDAQKLAKYFINQQKGSKKIASIELKENSYENFESLKCAVKKILNIKEKQEYNFKIDKKFLTMDLKQATDFFQKTYLTRLLEKEKKIKNVSTIAKINRSTIYRTLLNKSTSDLK